MQKAPANAEAFTLHRALVAGCQNAEASPAGIILVTAASIQ